MKERILKIILSMHHPKRDYTLAVSEEAFSPKKFADTMNQISHNLKTNGCIYFYEVSQIKFDKKKNQYPRIVNYKMASTICKEFFRDKSGVVGKSI